MKVTQLLTFALGALAAVSRRQNDLPSALMAISSATSNLNTAIQGFSGDIGPVNSATESVLSAITSAQSLVDSTDSLTTEQALAAAGPTGGINDAVAAAIASLIAKKSALVAACQGPAVYQSLQTQQAASAKLSSSIVSKLPQALQDLGKNASAPAAASLQEGLSAFQGVQGCSSSSGAATASAYASSSAAAGSSAATATAYASSAPKATGAASSTAGAAAPAKNGTAPAISPVAPQTYTGAGVKSVASFGAIAAALIAVAAY